mmetsp:Transcript_42944/g.41301  ORF Transcript_42944/g.41301 Transcript_42944/m.41301 type:complete len:257 (+) Transcript_42944:565-1335(+)|eukprot:CAMPEP_0170549856 /NCGR_PEP_ID=MMETSP0211-20121228/7980_1 /TAXON_ID=311385 /ORGANISM="Pseudokeronopsis sp., Strain OXSARD2" /LENGTH=256 /DNA_ID=CAMNT_0010856105 /DNA_START=701 /DNA_END=1471 /DNA_ORIENTATION=-
MSRIFTQITNDLTELNSDSYDLWKADLMFILTPTSSLNHEATTKFIDHLQSNVKERIKMVICLETLSNMISSQKELFVSPGFMTPHNELYLDFVKELEKAAHKVGTKVELRQPEPFYQGKRFLQQEHLIFNEKGIPAFTISAKNEVYRSKNEKYTVFDNAISKDDLRRNIQIISEALIQIIYNFNSRSINYFIDNPSLINTHFFDQMTNFLLKNPRAPHMIQRDSDLSKEFQKLLTINLNSNSQQEGAAVVKKMGI